MSPKVTVCMPTYNFESYLAEAIESVLMQTYTDFEFLIIDDCSHDASVRIIQSYALKDDRIRLIVNTQNLGMVRNWNNCLEKAGGEFIKFLFGDDRLSSPDALEMLVRALESDPSAALVASARTLIDEQSNFIRVEAEYGGNGKWKGVAIIQDCLLEQRNKIGEPTVVMFRKAHAHRGFMTSYQQLVDLEMWFHILEQGDFVFLNEPLCSFRVHPAQQTRKNLSLGVVIDESYMLLKEYSRKPYIRMSWFKREYMKYMPVYSVWQRYKRHHKITKQDALDKICGEFRYSMARFSAFYPLFKCYKLYRETARKVKRRSDTCTRS